MKTADHVIRYKLGNVQVTKLGTRSRRLRQSVTQATAPDWEITIYGLPFLRKPEVCPYLPTEHSSDQSAKDGSKIICIMATSDHSIFIMDPTTPERIACTFMAPQAGRTLSEILFFLDIVTDGGFIINGPAYLSHHHRNLVIDLTGDGNTLVIPGSYDLMGDPVPTVTKASPTPRLFPSTPATSRAGTSNPAAAAEALEREVKFRDRVLQRDRWCCVTDEEDVGECIGAHVIPFAWKKNNVIGLLPPPIRDHILDLPLGIDDVRNGFFVHKNLHNDFDAGKWAIRVADDGTHRFFGLSGKYCSGGLHGKIIRLPSGLSPSGIDTATLFPDRVLWEHHLRCSVFGMMKARAVDAKDDDKQVREGKGC